MRAVFAVVIALTGAMLGLVGAFLQAFVWWTPLGQIPVGLIAALLILVVLIRGAIWWIQARWAGWLIFIGWCAGTAVMAFESPSGDVALGAGTRPLVYLIVGAILGAFAATLPMPRSRVAS